MTGTRHLLVPGLLGPAPRGGEDVRLPPLPSLETLLARAHRGAGFTDYRRAAFALFGLESAPDMDLPTAALCYAQDADCAPAGYWMHADPVHLRPDQDRLILFDSHGLDITDHEADGFVAAFNAHFAADGIELVAPNARRWYLRLGGPGAVKTASLDKVVGRNVDHFLPGGDDRRYWRRLLNEVQMLFHPLEVNREREARGQLPISGVWFSGAGAAPARGTTSIRRTRGGDLLVAALAAHADIDGDDELWVELGPWRGLLSADARAWRDALAGFDRSAAELIASDVESRLHPCDGTCFRWRAKMRRRFWRRIRPLESWLAVEAGRADAPGQTRTALT